MSGLATRSSCSLGMLGLGFRGFWDWGFEVVRSEIATKIPLKKGMRTVLVRGGRWASPFERWVGCSGLSVSVLIVGCF